MSRHVYAFDAALPARDPKELLGGKGAGLNAMTVLGIPVPPGFTITTDVCLAWRANHGLPDGLETELKVAMEGVELRAGRRFGDPSDPLLVSVRSGARVSMPAVPQIGQPASTTISMSMTSATRRRTSISDSTLRSPCSIVRSAWVRTAPPRWRRPRR